MAVKHVTLRREETLILYGADCRVNVVAGVLNVLGITLRAGDILEHRGLNPLVVKALNPSKIFLSGVEEALKLRRTPIPKTWLKALNLVRNMKDPRVMVVGPQGSGKTMLAKASSNTLDATFFEARASSFSTGWNRVRRNRKGFTGMCHDYGRTEPTSQQTECCSP